MNMRILIILSLILFTATVALCGDDVPVVISGSCGLPGGDACNRPLTLSTCYFRALAQSETIAINADRIREADARFLQALSIMLPHVSFISADYQEEKVTDPYSSTSSLLNPKSSQRAFNYTQTLFSGFKAFAAVKASGIEKKQRTKEKERAEQLLLIDVSNAFYLVAQLRADLRALAVVRKALEDRVVTLRARERLGRSRPSEVVYAKTQLYSVRASIETVRNQEIVARQLLEFLIGGPCGNLQDAYDLPPDVEPLDRYLVLSDKRPDVEAAKFGWEFNKSAARVIDSDFLPKVDVDANYYTQRTAFDKGVDWDVTLAVKVPIFWGTETLGRSQEAWLKADESRLEYQRVRRKAPYDIKDAYTRVTTAMSVFHLRRKEYAAAKLNYHLQRKDYERSLVSNLDVLAAIQALQDSQRSFILSLYEAKRQYWQLRVAVGQSIQETLNESF